MTPAARTARPRWGRGLLGLLLVIAASWGALLLAPPTGTGDPALVSVSPSDGATVKSPDEVRLTFDRPVPAGLVTVRMTVPSGDQVVEGPPQPVAGEENSVAVPMPLTRYGGTYSVAWSVPSSTLEPITGSSRFHVFAPTPPVAVPQVPAGPSPVVGALHDVFRIAATAAFALGTGLAFALAAAWPAGVDHPPARRPITYAWCGLVVATLGAAVTFGGYAARLPVTEAFDPAVVAAGFASEIGGALLVRLLVLVPVTAALVQWLTGPYTADPAQRGIRSAAVLAVAAAPAATWALARPGHPPLAVAAEVALLLAVAVCAGGPVLLWVLMRTAGDVVLRLAVPRLARLMPVAGVLLLVIAPVAAAGWRLVALLVLGVLSAATGLAGRWWVRRRAGARGRDASGRARLRRLAAIAAAAVAAALLGSAVPASGSALLAQPDGGPAPAEVAR